MLLAVFYAVLPCRSYSQTSPSNHTLKGVVVDSATKKPADYVTIALKTAADKSIKSALSDNEGAFVFDNIDNGAYKIVIVAVGYKSKTVSVAIDSSKQTTDLGKIEISAESKQIGEVVVTADRPLVKQEVDRIAYDVQADPENKINNVLDMLRKVPLISMDAEDNIQVKGSSSYKVLINGRPSSLVARDPKEVFKSMPASNIQKIEVITTPPAKYDSEGLAGIINIITNKKIDNGYNASMGVRTSSPNGHGGNASLTYKAGKFGFQGYGGLHLNRRPETSSGSLRIGLGANQDRLIQNGISKNRSNFGYGDTELSYEIDTLNLITGSVGFNGSKSNNTSTQFSNLFDQNGALQQAYTLNNSNEFGWGGMHLGINYQLGFKNNKERLLTTSYKYTDSDNDQNGEVTTTQNVNYPGNNFLQNNNAGSNEQTIQVDYTHPLKIFNIEGGVKGILRDNFSQYEQLNFDPASQQYIENPARSNEFDYQQDIFGFYNSYQLKLKDWGAKAGLRLERTIVNADFQTTATEVKQAYNNFIPSISVQRKFKDMSSLNVGYTQRIERPGIWQLNPFINQNDPRFISTGNPDLEAVLNHSFELTYSKFKKGSVNVTLGYSFADNTVEYVTLLRPDNVTFSTYDNVGNNKNLSSNISINYPLTQRFNVNVNGRLAYIWVNGIFNGQQLSNEGVQGNLFSYAGYRFEKGWRAGVNAGFFSPWISLQRTFRFSYHTSFSINKEFLDKKATLSLSTSNPWTKFREWRSETTSPDFLQTTYNNNFFRSVDVSFNYRFGKLESDIKKNRRGIKNDDVSGGSSGGGNQ